jgi:hypothetical protein
MSTIGCPTCNARNRVGPIARGIPRCRREQVWRAVDPVARRDPGREGDRPRRRRAASGRVGAAVGAGARRVNSRSRLERGGASRREPASRVPRLAGKRSRRIDRRPMGKAGLCAGAAGVAPDSARRGSRGCIQRGGAADATGRDDCLRQSRHFVGRRARRHTRLLSAITSRVEMVAALGDKPEATTNAATDPEPFSDLSGH